MKSYMFLYIALIFFFSAACDNRKAERDDLDADTTSITEGFNPRGLPSEGVHEDQVHTRDSIEANLEEDFVPADLPSSIKNKISSNDRYRNKEITHARRLVREGDVYYELSFDRDPEDKIVVDEDGNLASLPVRQ